MAEFAFDIAILGGGQLARMSAQAAQRLGLRVWILDPDDQAPARQICAGLSAPIESEEGLREAFRVAQNVTLENEFIPAELIQAALEASGRDPQCLKPGCLTLGIIQDKLRQREAYRQAGVPSPRAVPAARAAELGFPCVLKARFRGYDGKGTLVVQNEAEYEAARSRWDQDPWLAEEFVPFRRELAVMVARSNQEIQVFPTMETVQTNHVCDLVYPADVDASDIAVAAVEAVEGFGLFGVELFETPDGQLTVNEMAPRPHNTGHYTLDWGGVSQFEMHVRLCMGWSLPETMGLPVAMANLLGQEGAQDVHRAIGAAFAADPEVNVHWYGKMESRPGRKMGHINAVGPDAQRRAVRAREAFYKGWCS